MTPTDSLDLIAKLLDRRLQGGENALAPGDRRRGGHAELSAVVGAVYARAAALTQGLRAGPEADRLAATVLVAGGLSGLWVERRWRAEEVTELLERAAGIVGAPVDSFTLAVSLHALNDPALLELPPGLAIEAQVGLLRALGRLDDVSLWLRERAGPPQCLAHAGDAQPSPAARAVADAILDGARAPGGGAAPGGRGQTDAGPFAGVAVKRWQRPHAALVAQRSADGCDAQGALLDEAAAMIGPMLERHALLERNAARESSLVKAGERRLTRLGFDLHDQPLQQVAVLAGELRSFRDQLASGDLGAEHRRILVGRVQDLEAQLASLDGGLRALCHSLESTTLAARPLADLLRREAAAYAAQADTEVELRIEGEFDQLTDSQRIALVRVVQECLSNAREHSGATAVQVAVRSTTSHVEATVTDNGRGFDVEETLLDAARRGRLGLVGVHERVRLLGGACDVTSRPGGPTTVSVVLSRWRPHALAATAEQGAS